jgi:hypothetical protein
MRLYSRAQVGLGGELGYDEGSPGAGPTDIRIFGSVSIVGGSVVETPFVGEFRSQRSLDPSQDLFADVRQKL